MKIRLDQLSCLESLRKCLLSKFSPHPDTELRDEWIDRDAIKDLGKIIPHTSRLKNLDFCLHPGIGNPPPWYSQIKVHALEILGPTVPRLENLVLEGDLQFTAKALQSWSHSLQNLRSLSLNGISLINRISKIIPDQMPLLKTLKLSAFEIRRPRWTLDSNEDYRQLTTFLSHPQMEKISLFGFPPRILEDAIKFSGPFLKTIRFHICEDAIGLYVRRGPPLSTLLLTSSYLETMRSTCPTLRSLTLDLGRSNLPFDWELFQATPHLLNSLRALTLMPQLQHLHIFLHNDVIARRSSDPTTEDILITYASIRKHKCGYPLKDLLICSDQQRWEVWDSGPGRVVTMLYRNGRGLGEWVRETWDLGEESGVIERIGPIVKGNEETVGQNGQWCVTEGWG